MDPDTELGKGTSSAGKPVEEPPRPEDEQIPCTD